MDDIEADKFQLYPNPTLDNIQIKTDFKIDNIEIIDNSGNIVLQTEKNDLNISSLATGVYFVRIYSDNQIIMKKIVKE